MNKKLLEIIKTHRGIESGLFKGRFGLEKEHIRVNTDGQLSQKRHPEKFKDKIGHPYVTNDFSESQVELITPVFNSIEETYNFMETCTELFYNEIGDQILWPQSAPPILPEENDIPIAAYDQSEKGLKYRAYREMLASKYGRKKQTISGLHFNFSLEESFIKELFEKAEPNGDYKFFKDNLYLKMSRNFIRYAWVLTYLFGASPATDQSFLDGCVMRMEKSELGDPYFPYATSIRNGVCGYRNHNNFIVSYDSVEQYINEIKDLMSKGQLYDEKEYYSPLRLKTHSKGDFFENLEKEGILYIEIRVLDIDPLDVNGISKETLTFMHLFMLFMLFKEEDCFGKELHEISLENYELVASRGREPGLMLGLHLDERIELDLWGKALLMEMNTFFKDFKNVPYDFEGPIDKMIQRFEDSRVTPSAMVLKHILEEGYISWHLKQGQMYKKKLLKQPYLLKGCTDLELSTQILIKDAIGRGLHVELIDKADNFIRIEDKDKKKYVKQATKTDLDSYATFLMMENKVVTKRVLEEAGIHVPGGGIYDSIDMAREAFHKYEGSEIVIKPKSTNFGLGITIFKNGVRFNDYLEALKLAFSYDQTVLIEYFVPGKEYRFFVMGDEVVGVLHRVPANVTGDGCHTISELVMEKNKDVLRGKGYKTPLEKIQLGQVEKMFLKEQNLDENSILDEGQVVYLRENSNVSTGGDSIDFTDVVHPYYKEKAVEAAKAVGAVICGVDMMLLDIARESEDYSIIELNFNPAIHIHCYPYKGENRDLGNRLLDLLGF